jgi:hypothetical protein
VKILQGGFYFHPSDDDLSLVTPAMKKPLRGRVVGYCYPGSAVAQAKLVSFGRAAFCPGVWLFP